MVEHNLFIETANKIINKQGKSVILDSLQTEVIYASKRWRQVEHHVYFIVAIM